MAIEEKVQITENCDVARAQLILQDFYKAYKGRVYGLLEMLAFAYEEGIKDLKNNIGREQNAQGYLRENGDIHD